MLCRDQAFAVLLEEKKNKKSSNVLGKMRSEDEMILLVCIMVSCAVLPGLLSVLYYCCADSSLLIYHRVYGFCFSLRWVMERSLMELISVTDRVPCGLRN